MNCGYNSIPVAYGKHFIKNIEWTKKIYFGVVWKKNNTIR